MRIYLVGGAVRDRLLGLEAPERDWVVVGARPEDLARLGYRPVGRDFPVFLHPETHEEYALARTERKTGQGYHGFTFHAEPDVTLEEDLRRRDLTVNAMAQDDAGALTDPFGGQRDLRNRLLRHVSPAFNEDPLRVLRVARFAARFAPLGFQVADETLQRMADMARGGEVAALTPERVFQELRRALMEPAPEQFVRILAACHAWEAVFPLLPNPEPVAQALHQAAADDLSETARFACMALHAESISGWCQALRVPRAFREAGELLHRHIGAWRQWDSQDPAGALDLIQSADGVRRPQRFEEFRAAAQTADAAVGRDSGRHAKLLQAAHAAVLKCDEGAIAKRGDGKSVQKRIRQARLEAIRKVLK